MFALASGGLDIFLGLCIFGGLAMLAIAGFIIACQQFKKLL